MEEHVWTSIKDAGKTPTKKPPGSASESAGGGTARQRQRPQGNTTKCGNHSRIFSIRLAFLLASPSFILPPPLPRQGRIWKAERVSGETVDGHVSRARRTLTNTM